MMSNIDILTLTSYFIGSFACCLGIIFVSKFLLHCNLKSIKFYRYLLIIFFTFFYIINSLVFDNIAKLLGTLLILFFNYKLIFSKNNKDSFLYSIATCLIFIISETLFAFLTSVIDLLFVTNYGQIIIKSPIANLIISLFACLITYLVRNKVKKNIEILNKKNNVLIAFIGFVTALVTLASIYKLSINNWRLNYTFILNMIIIYGCISLMIILIRQYIESKEASEKYKIHEEYLKTAADLIEKYSSTIHKYNNNLIAIKGYINNDIDEANKYIDSLLDVYKDKKYSWFSKLNNITIDSIRYMLYYKLSKAEGLNLKLSIIVSKELKKQKFKNLSIHEMGYLSDIMGEYLDNAIYAANESLEKELILDIFIENNKLNFIISNTYKEKFDIKLITKNGYTTKGKGHGLGLYEIDKIIRKNEFIDNCYEVQDNYFIVKLSLDIIEFSDKK